MKMAVQSLPLRLCNLGKYLPEGEQIPPLGGNYMKLIQMWVSLIKAADTARSSVSAVRWELA